MLGRSRPSAERRVSDWRISPVDSRSLRRLRWEVASHLPLDLADSAIRYSDDGGDRADAKGARICVPFT